MQQKLLSDLQIIHIQILGLAIALVFLIIFLLLLSHIHLLKNTGALHYNTRYNELSTCRMSSQFWSMNRYVFWWWWNGGWGWDVFICAKVGTIGRMQGFLCCGRRVSCTRVFGLLLLSALPDYMYYVCMRKSEIIQISKQPYYCIHPQYPKTEKTIPHTNKPP